MTIAAGTRLGPYEVIAPLGAGGMGEVWRGRDTRLDRTVAIKVLPGDFTSDAKARFEREAKTISQLNHPHICTLYDVGDNYLVMELIEGETLAERLTKGPLPLDQLIRYAVQVSEALEKAHKAGVVHRDLKPANIMLTRSGAKLLDFGLAKPTDSGVITALTSVRTEQKNITEEGTLVGTFQYMAPEQLEGGAVDARTDIFALGAVLYEMATGKRAFDGKSKASVIASILTVEPPPIAAQQPLTPRALDRVVSMCLKKDPDERWQSAHDVAAELKWLSDGAVEARPQARRPYAWLAAALFAIAALVAGAMWWMERSASRNVPIVRTFITPPDKMAFDFQAYGAPPALSPDGRRIVFGATAADHKRTLWVRSLDSLVAQQLLGTEDATFPFWSPDGRHVAFFTDNTLKRIEVGGGAPLQICGVVDGRGGSWSPDGQTIVFGSRYSPIYRVPASGGTPIEVTKLEANEATHRWPEFLPDGRHFLYLASPSGNEDQQNTAVVGSIDGKTRKVLFSSADEVHYVTGALIFSREHILTARRFDVRTLQADDETVSLNEVPVEASPLLSRTVVAMNRDGTLLYQPGNATRSTQLLWFDRAGKAGQPLGSDAPYGIFAISPDGKQVATGYITPVSNIWTIDLERGAKTRLTFSATRDVGPVFSRDGRKIAYTHIERGRFEVHIKDLASGSDAKVYEGDAIGVPTVTSWSPAGDAILLALAGRTTRSDIVVLSFADRKIRPYLATPFIENNARFSPDGKWIVYQSNESGVGEVYLAPYPATGAKWQVSAAGGVMPRWRGDGKEIFFATNPANMSIVSVPVMLSTPPAFGAPVKLFSFNASVGALYDVTSDGQRFLVNTRVGDVLDQQPLVLVQHFDKEVRAALEHHD